MFFHRDTFDLLDFQSIFPVLLGIRGHDDDSRCSLPVSACRLSRRQASVQRIHHVFVFGLRALSMSPVLCNRSPRSVSVLALHVRSPCSLSRNHDPKGRVSGPARGNSVRLHFQLRRRTEAGRDVRCRAWVRQICIVAIFARGTRRAVAVTQVLRAREGP